MGQTFVMVLFTSGSSTASGCSRDLFTCFRPCWAGAADSEPPGHQEAGGRVWMYPSEQMFFNAMRRKGWRPSEGNMRTVVSIHNAVNERAWSEVSQGFCSVCVPMRIYSP